MGIFGYIIVQSLLEVSRKETGHMPSVDGPEGCNADGYDNQPPSAVTDLAPLSYGLY